MKRLFTFLSIILICTSAHAQIPNAGFENWTSVGSYVTPTSWDNPNSYTSIASVYTCDSGMDSPPAGAAYLKLTTQTVLTAAIPGVAVTGQISVSGTSYTVSGGFPYTVRPASLAGQWQYMGSGSDNARIGVFLWKWNSATSSRDTVALRDTTLTGMAMSWSSFSIPLIYSSGSMPDSAIIVLSSSASATSATAGSYLWIDDLAFSGTVPAGVISVNTIVPKTSVFPNPAHGQVTVYYHATSSGNVLLQVCDVTGSEVNSSSRRIVAGENNLVVDVSSLAQGHYFVRITNNGQVAEQQILVR